MSRYFTGEYTLNDASKEKGTSALEEGSYFKITFLDVGQGDSIVISCDGHHMIVDGGPDSAGTYVWKYLRDEGIERLDYLVGTHFDADHIGGLDVVAYKLECESVLLPDYKKDTKSYENLWSVIRNKNIKVIYPKTGDSYKLGSADIQVLSPKNVVYEDENDYSIVLRVTYDGRSFLLMGDATSDIEKSIIDDYGDMETDVLKVAHHGSTYSTSELFLRAISTRYAVISCGEDNDYGHPHESLLSRLQKHEIEIFRTDKQGNITMWVNPGEDIRVISE